MFTAFPSYKPTFNEFNSGIFHRTLLGPVANGTMEALRFSAVLWTFTARQRRVV